MIAFFDVFGKRKNLRSASVLNNWYRAINMSGADVSLSADGARMRLEPECGWSQSKAESDMSKKAPSQSAFLLFDDINCIIML